MIPKYDFADVSLEFLWTFAEDDGIYECVATNPYGEDRTRAELKCRPKRSIIYNTQLPEGMEGVSKLQMLEDEMRYTASMIGLEEKVQEKEAKAPEFIMPLEDLSVDEGENAKFIAKVDGHPRPRVTWSINGVDIANVRTRDLFRWHHSLGRFREADTNWSSTVWCIIWISRARVSTTLEQFVAWRKIRLDRAKVPPR